MGKSELFSHFAERFEVKRTQAREFFDELTTLAEKELKRSGEFVLPGMVKLVVQKRKARMGRNPATGEAIKIPAKTVVKARIANRPPIPQQEQPTPPGPGAARRVFELVSEDRNSAYTAASCVGRALVTGKRSVKVVPTPTWLVTEIAPPSCSTIFFESARPSPSPCFFVV